MIFISDDVYTKQQICKHLVSYQHLSDDTAIENTDILECIRKVGFIQYGIFMLWE